MKLLIVNTSTGWGGLEMNVIKLAGELQKNKVEIFFVSKMDTAIDKQLVGSFENVLQLKNTKKYFDFKNASVVANYMKTNDITTVFTAYRADLDLLAWTKRKLKNCTIIYQQHMQIGLPKKGFFQRLRFKSVDLWLTPLNWLKQEALEKTTIDEKKIRIVPIGVRKEAFLSDQPSKEEAQQFFDFQTNSFVIGVIGRIDEKKGQLFLIETVKKLIDAGEDIFLLIVGTPTVDDPRGAVYFERIKQFIQENKLEKCVHFSPATKDVNKFYQAIDLFVMSSEGETFGMVTVEALFSKIAVIGTNTSGTPEVLGHGSRGELYSFNDSQSFIEAYQKVRKKLKSGELDLLRIQQEAMELYSLDKEVEGVLKALAEN